MISIVLIALVVPTFARSQDCHLVRCNTGLAKYYTELGCLPIKGPGACCPYRFDCNAAFSRRVSDKCHLKGEIFDKDETLTSEQMGDKCISECRCVVNGQLANFECVNIECIEHMGVPAPPGCVYQYAPQECCSTGYDCSNSTQTGDENIITCVYNGKTYSAGQEIEQKENPCMACKCQRGFDGTLREPWCSKFNCGIEIHYGARIREGCAPIHFGKNWCCPIGWRCPDQSDSVIRAVGKVINADWAECVFGSLHLKLGDKLNTLDSEQCVECECTVPPHVSCVKTKC